jgi:hypothetical protein
MFCEEIILVHSGTRTRIETRPVGKIKIWEISKERERDDRLGGLVVRGPGYRSRGPGFDSRHYQILWEIVSLQRGPPSLVTTNEELLERKVAARV